jgi:hypothetical protein
MRGSLVKLATLLLLLLLASCKAASKAIQEELHTPYSKDFSKCFQWFIELFTPNNLTNHERIVFTILIAIIIGSSFALINSRRALNFFKDPPFNNKYLSVLLLSPNFLTFSLRGIKHPGWALGLWVLLRFLFLCILLILSFILIFYFAVILPDIIVVIIGIIIYVIVVSIMNN